MKYFGAHVSAKGGVFNAPLNARKIGGEAFALFTANQRRWDNPPLTDEAAALFKSNMRSAGMDPAFVVAHDSYLINLASPDLAQRTKSVASLKEEASRVGALGLRFLNIHPGNHLGAVDEGSALKTIARGIDEVLKTSTVTILIENTAGQGTALGYRLEHIAGIMEQSSYPERLGVCVDTCHAWAAGYDIADDEGFDLFWDRFRVLFGDDGLKAMHINDSKNALGSMTDRHAPLGEGHIGTGCFKRIADSPFFDDIPLILETPDPEKWAYEIRMLKGTDE